MRPIANDELRDLTPEESYDIVMWAIRAGSIVTMMKHHPVMDTTQENLDKLAGFIEAVDIMYNDMTPPMIDPTHDVAIAIIESLNEDEIVDEFRKQLEAL